MIIFELEFYLVTIRHGRESMINKRKEALLKKIDKVVNLAENELNISDRKFYAALDDLYDEIDNLPSEVDWILPSDRLPLKHELDKNCCVLATLNDGSVEKVKFNFGHNEFNPMDGVIAWQPIPKPYSDLSNIFRKLFGKK